MSNFLTTSAQNETTATKSKNLNLNMEDSIFSTNASVDDLSSLEEKYNDDDDDLHLNVKPNLTVEEIFARGIEEWKKAREEVTARRKAEGRASKPGPPLPRSMRGPLYDPRYDAGFDKEVEEILQPNRRKLFNVVNKSSAEKVTVEGNAKEERSSELFLDAVLERQIQRNREATSASASETREATENDADAFYKRKVNKWGGHALDALRVFVVVAVSFMLTGLPWYLEKDFSEADVIEFSNITESNICYWVGGRSILSEMNPCPYRGYMSMDKEANSCLPWREVIENEKWVEALNANEDTETHGVSMRDYLKWVRKLATLYDGQDYNAPVCRRLGKDLTEEKANYPKCFVIRDKEKNVLEVPKLSNCWVVPCTITISNDCYKKLWMKKNDPLQNGNGS